MSQEYIRNAALGSIDGGQAYMTFDEAVADFPAEHYNTRPTNVPYSLWHLLEHIRICNRDILQYLEGDTYIELAWPEEGWPAPDAETDEAGWNATIQAIRDDMAALRALAEAPDADFAALARHAEGNPKHTLLRQIVVVTDHNAYHLGEFAILRQVLGLWSASHQ